MKKSKIKILNQTARGMQKIPKPKLEFLPKQRKIWKKVQKRKYSF